jgi:hypothetical protein
MTISQAQTNGHAFAAKLTKMAQDLKAVDNNSLFDQDPRESFVSCRSHDGFYNTAKFQPTGEVVSMHRELSYEDLDREYECKKEFQITVGAESTKYLYRYSEHDANLMTDFKTRVEFAEIASSGEILDYQLRDSNS